MPQNVSLRTRTLAYASRMMVAATMRRARQIMTGTITEGPDAAATASMLAVLDGVEVHVTVTLRGPNCTVNLPGLPLRKDGGRP